MPRNNQTYSTIVNRLVPNDAEKNGLAEATSSAIDFVQRAVDAAVARVGTAQAKKRLVAEGAKNLAHSWDDSFRNAYETRYEEHSYALHQLGDRNLAESAWGFGELNAERRVQHNYHASA